MFAKTFVMQCVILIVHVYIHYTQNVTVYKLFEVAHWPAFVVDGAAHLGKGKKEDTTVY